jgi:hypothetical protein
MWHTMQVLVGGCLTNLCRIGCPLCTGLRRWFSGERLLTVGSLLKLRPSLPNHAHIPLWIGLRSLAYMTWQALHPLPR